MKLVQLGCGPTAKPGHWLDFDGSWNARLNRYPAFIRRLVRNAYRLTGKKVYDFPKHVQFLSLYGRLPFADQTVDAIFASHVWEHLIYDKAVAVTAECWRVLKPGGAIRLIVPPLDDFCEIYARSPDQTERAMALNRALLFRELGVEKSRLFNFFTKLADLHIHKFMYDRAFLSELLKQSRFTGVHECGLLETEIPYLDEVEQPGRLGYGVGFAIEGYKPLSV